MMTVDMNPEIRAQWCAALRSGQYPQTTEALRRLEAEGNHPAGYCCLGVLIDLWLKAGHGEMVADDYAAEDGLPAVASVWEHTEGCLAPEVRDWAGLDSVDPELRPDMHGNAVMVNDGGATFAEIADLIDGGAS